MLTSLLRMRPARLQREEEAESFLMLMLTQSSLAPAAVALSSEASSHLLNVMWAPVPEQQENEPSASSDGEKCV